MLGLQSELKDSEDGFLEYYEQRQARLNSLVDAEISVWFEFSPLVDKNTLIIGISDSGKGFDVDKVRDSLSERDEDLSYGRGLSLINSLAKDVSFSNGGSTIEIRYDLAAD